MFSALWHNVFFDPIYNGLIFFVNTIPGADLGLAIVALTVLVKIVLLPLSIKASKTQHAMRAIEPKLKEIKENFKNNREKLAMKTMEVYREAGINPFASIFLVFLQIPIIIALYLAVFNGGGVRFPEVNTDLLYSFVHIPEQVNMWFLGFVNIAEKSFMLAALAGATQFVHTNLAMPAPEPRDPNAAPSFGDDFKRSMHLQMRYVMPLIIFFVAYTISAAIALYFLVSNITAIAQEFFIRKHAPRPEAGETADEKKGKKE